jgi:GDP-mannose 6-dehydrogenase
MRVLVWGLGYVGAVVSACLAELGHHVTGIDVNPEKVAVFNQGISPVKEPHLDALIQKGRQAGRLVAVTNGQDLVAQADISLICVGTPSAADGSPQIQYLEAVAREIGQGLATCDKYHIVVVRSTVFPKMTRNLIIPSLEKAAGKIAGQDFGVAFNPEFLRETSAIHDFHEPPYTIIGTGDARTHQILAGLYQDIDAPLYQVGIEEAELIKMVNNSYHALKVGFANEIGRLCGALTIDANTVMNLVCADYKLNISPTYLKPGFAFGGSCLPKDLRSLTFYSRRLGRVLPILESVLPSNDLQIEAARIKIHESRPKKVTILGLSFKVGTDDLRESPVIALINQLWADGLEISVYDQDVELHQMIGSNRAYLERHMPQIYQILTTELEMALDSTDLVVLTKYVNELEECQLRYSYPIIDLAHLNASSTPLSIKIPVAV